MRVDFDGLRPSHPIDFHPQLKDSDAHLALRSVAYQLRDEVQGQMFIEGFSLSRPFNPDRDKARVYQIGRKIFRETRLGKFFESKYNERITDPHIIALLLSLNHMFDFPGGKPSTKARGIGVSVGEKPQIWTSGLDNIWLNITPKPQTAERTGSLPFQIPSLDLQLQEALKKAEPIKTDTHSYFSHGFYRPIKSGTLDATFLGGRKGISRIVSVLD